MHKETDIARSVLALAKAIDPRMPQPDRAVLLAWAGIFRGQPVWPEEAIEAVNDHYRAADAPRLMPGDVIASCKKQDIWSSRNHIEAFLDDMARYPYSPAIEAYSGIRPPQAPQPSTYEQDREFHRAWIAENRELLIAAILARKFRYPEVER